MKKKQIFILINIIMLLNLIGCSGNQGRLMKPDTPVNTALIARNALISGNYSLFNSLFTEGRKNSISEQEFQKIRKGVQSGSAGFTSFQLVTLPNGDGLLIRLSPEKDSSGNYGIEDIKVVPKESMEMFEVSSEGSK